MSGFGGYSGGNGQTFGGRGRGAGRRGGHGGGGGFHGAGDGFHGGGGGGFHGGGGGGFHGGGGGGGFQSGGGGGGGGGGSFQSGGGARGGGGFQGGGGGRGRGRRQNRGRGRVRGGMDAHAEMGISDGTTIAETPFRKLCNHHLTGSCSYGDRCRMSHQLGSINVQAHAEPINSIATLEATILTGSSENSIKAWQLQEAGLAVAQDFRDGIETVRCIQTLGTALFWSADEIAQTEAPSPSPVGVVNCVMNPAASMIPTKIRQSDLAPFTHTQEILSFKVVQVGESVFVITAGKEGLIKMWQFSTATQSFTPYHILEGHVRGVTCLAHHETMLWSGSDDFTVKVWDLTSLSCVKTIGYAGDQSGHEASVSCLELVPGSCVVSGGLDGLLFYWNPSTGEKMFFCPEQAAISSLKAFQDELGGIPCIIVGLANGVINIRSLVTGSWLLTVEGAAAASGSVLSIQETKAASPNSFATGGESGFLFLWFVQQPLVEPS